MKCLTTCTSDFSAFNVAFCVSYLCLSPLGYSQILRGAQVESFWGIPYAKPPTGSRRFRPPIKAGPWRGIRHSKVSICPQINWAKLGTFTGKEDCLVLNVFRPKPAGSKKLTVMVCIVYTTMRVYNPIWTGNAFSPPPPHFLQTWSCNSLQ